MNFNQIRRLFIFVILSFCFVGFASAQSWIKKLRSPVFYEIGIQTAWQSNAFNASVGEVEYTATAPEYLGGVTTVSSPELVGLAKIRYEPRLWRGYKSKVRASIFVHHFTEFSIKDFRSMSFNLNRTLEIINLFYYRFEICRSFISEIIYQKMQRQALQVGKNVCLWNRLIQLDTHIDLLRNIVLAMNWSVKMLSIMLHFHNTILVFIR